MKLESMFPGQCAWSGSMQWSGLDGSPCLSSKNTFVFRTVLKDNNYKKETVVILDYNFMALI